MMCRRDVEDALNKIGVPIHNKGFQYIIDAMLIMDDNPNCKITKYLYPEIASKNGTTAFCVERNIRHAFEIARRSKENYEEVEHYLGLTHCSNGNSLRMLHAMIKRDEDAVLLNRSKENISAEEIREIVREELKAILGGVV